MLENIKNIFPPSFRKKVKHVFYGKSIEEEEVVFHFFNQGQQQGTMIDVGAHVGNSLLPFAKKEWSIFAFEPDKNNRKELVTNTSNLSNVQIDTRAVSNEDNLELDFFSSNVSKGISGLSNFHDSHKKTDVVKTVTLKTFCQQNKIEDISFLKIDTEGFDLFVLKGFDWDNQKHPDIIVTEFEDNKTQPLGYTFFEQADFLQQRNYKLLTSEWQPIVEYGKRHKWKRFVKDYKKINSPDAWGNIIAVKEKDYQKLIAVASTFGVVE